jgi:6,7-dimethyl-8-ribityllumazine synthase
VGVVIAGSIREFSLVVGETAYSVFYVHVGDNIGLAAVYEASDKKRIEARRQELRDLFKKGGQK